MQQIIREFARQVVDLIIGSFGLMIDEYSSCAEALIVCCDQLSGFMITIWENTASDLQYHVFFLGVGLARTGSRDSDLTSDEYR